MVKRIGGAVFRLNLQELLLGQNYILELPMKFYPAMNRNLAQRKSPVLAAGSMITPHQPFCLDQEGAPQMLASGEHQLHHYLVIIKLFLEFLAAEPH